MTKLVGLGRKAQKQDSNVPNKLLLLEGREGVKWSWNLAFLEAEKWDLVHWDWDS